MRQLSLSRLLYLAPSVVGWGGDGHRIITMLAEETLSDRSSKYLMNHVGEDIEQASVWADTETAETKYPQSNFYHFSSTPYRNCGDFVMKRDCGFGKSKGFCIVTGLRDAITRAMDISLSAETRADAVKFVIHLMADIHQPLHTGFREDTGGLRIGISRPNGTDLHYIWDHWLIDEMKRKIGATSWRGIADSLRKRLEHNNGALKERMRVSNNMTTILSSEENIVSYLSLIASETSNSVTCKFGYTHADGSWIGVNDAIEGTGFYEARQPTMIVQLLKATVRLSLLLEGISDEYYKRRLERPRVPAVVTTNITELFATEADTRSSNYFDVLYLEAPDEEDIVDSESVAASALIASLRKPVSKPKLTSSVEDTAKLVDLAIHQAAAEKASYIFHGYDLLDIILVREDGRLIITSRTANSSKKPRGAATSDTSRMIRINYGGSGQVEQRVYHLDGDVFSHFEWDEELIVRIILKISKVDPRIDITEYIGRIRPVLPTGSQLAQHPILLYMLYNHRVALSKLTATVKQQIQRVKRQDIVFHQLVDKTMVFVHKDRLSTSSRASQLLNRKFVMMFSGLGDRRENGTRLPRQVLVDSLIAIGNFAQDFKLLLGKAVPVRGLLSSHSFWNEITEVAKIIDEREAGLDAGLDNERPYVDWVFDYPGIEGNWFRVVEWSPKGVFPCELSVLSHLGFRLPSNATVSPRS